MIELGLDRIAHDAAPTGDLLAQKCPRSPFRGPHGAATDVFGKFVRAEGCSRQNLSCWADG